MGQLSSRQITKILKQSVKQDLHNQGINPHTRRGNKELTLLINQVAQGSFTSIAAAQTAGAALAARIVELSQQQGKQNLDAGVIRRLSLGSSWQALIDLPASPEPPTAATEASLPPVAEPFGKAKEVDKNTETPTVADRLEPPLPEAIQTGADRDESTSLPEPTAPEPLEESARPAVNESEDTEAEDAAVSAVEVTANLEETVQPAVSELDGAEAEDTIASAAATEILSGMEERPYSAN